MIIDRKRRVTTIIISQLIGFVRAVRLPLRI